MQSALRQQPVLFAAQSGAHAAPTFLQEPLTVLRGLPADVRRLIAGAIAGELTEAHAEQSLKHCQDCPAYTGSGIS